MKVYAGYYNEESVLKGSSSGGIFYALSEYVIENNGIVVGSVYNPQNKELNYTICKTIEEVKACRGSKYFQSNPGDILREVISYIKEMRIVLICGTPCHLAGFKNYLSAAHIDVSRVFFVDLFCHGVPSPYIWKEYVKRIEKLEKNTSIDVSFKDKRNGWFLPFAYLKFPDKEYEIREFDRLYYKDLISRPCCYECRYANLERVGDISIGDFWAVKEKKPTIYNYLGVSSILVNTEKGTELLNAIKGKLVCEEAGIEDSSQQCLRKPVEKPSDRADFWRDIKEKDFGKVFDSYTKVSTRQKIVNKIRRVIGKQK